MRKIKFITIFIIILGSIYINLVYSSVVSDNDGSAFITKAEFDSLKNTFQSQIDSYNQGIDSKIDSAIASYLAGITVTTQTTEKVICSSIDECTMLKQSTLPTYSYGRLGLKYAVREVRESASILDTIFEQAASKGWDKTKSMSSWSSDSSLVSAWGSERGIGGLFDVQATINVSPTNSKKNLISDTTKITGTSNYFAKWQGYCPDVSESLSGSMNVYDDYPTPNGATPVYLCSFAWIPSTAKNTSFETRNDLFNILFGSGNEDCRNYPQSPTNEGNTATHTYTTINYKNLCVYDDGNYSGKFFIKDGNDYLAKDLTGEKRSVWRAATTLTNCVNKQFICTLFSTGQWRVSGAVYNTNGGVSNSNPTTAWDTSTNYGATPQFGADPNITKWNQIVSNNLYNNCSYYTSDVATKTIDKVYLQDGLPIIAGKENKKISYKLSFKDTSKDYDVYFKYDKFSGTPVESDCIAVNCTSGNVTTTNIKKISVKNGKATITFNCDQYKPIYIKWTVTGGGGSGTIDLTGDSAKVTYSSES